MIVRNPPAVLVVEDEAFTRMVAMDTIGDLGLDRFEAGNAAEALELMEEHPEVGLLFTDINMPGPMDGLRLAERVHRLWPRVELILTSGAQTLADDALPDNGTFLPKPYGPGRLAALVREKMADFGSPLVT